MKDGITAIHGSREVGRLEAGIVRGCGFSREHLNRLRGMRLIFWKKKSAKPENEMPLSEGCIVPDCRCWAIAPHVSISP